MCTLARAVAISALLVVVAGAPSCGNAPPPPPVLRALPANLPPAVEAIVQRAIDRYGSARSYRDKGTGTTTLGSVGTTSLDFDTAFTRGGGFRWRYTSDLLPGGLVRRTGVVWSADAATWNFWSELTRTRTQHTSLGMAIAGPTGTSYGLVRIVPELLYPNLGPSTLFLGLAKPTVRGTDTVNGVSCDVIEGGLLGSNGTTTLWIDQTGAIRKYRRTMKVDSSKIPTTQRGSPERTPTTTFDVVTEFVFEPQFDVDMSPSDTDFTPPS